MQRLLFFCPTPGGRSVVDTFIGKELKKLRGVGAALIDHLKIMEQTPFSTLREQQKVEYIRDGLLVYGFSTRDHWIRIFVTVWPTAETIQILRLAIKKQNRLDLGDVEMALRNLATLKLRK